MNLPRLAAPSAGMLALDRMGWTAGLSIAAYGRTLGVRVNDPQLLKDLPPRLPYGWKPASGRAPGPTVERLYSILSGGGAHNPRLRRPHMLYSGADRLARSLHLAHILDAFETDARLFVAENARRRIFVHAAVVAWRDRAIVIPGESMSGKTSLAAAFVRAGATYYSDEYAVLDRLGRVHPYAKPLSIRYAEKGYTQVDYPVESFGGTSGTKALTIGMVLLTHYVEGARWRPRAVSRGMGVMSLLANTLKPAANPSRTMDALHRAVGSASVFKSSRGEAVPVVRSVLTSLINLSLHDKSERNI